MHVGLSQLVGHELESAVTLLDYGYRGAWRVKALGETYLVKADERPGAIRREVAAHQHAAAHGIPVPELGATVGDPNPGVSFRWVEGVALHGSIVPEAWRAAGRVLRRIHELPPLDDTHPIDRLWPFEAEIEWMVANGGLTRSEADAALSVAEPLRLTVEAAPLAWTHGDCQAAHFIMNPATNEVAAVIDWADAGFARPEMDFAVLALFDAGALEWILEGYEASPQLRDSLARTLPYFQALRAAGSYRWLETHGYQGQTWPAETIRAFIRG